MDKTVMENELYYGKNTVKEILETKEVLKVYLQKGFKDNEIKQSLKEKNVPFVLVEKIKLDKMTNDANHQGIVAMLSAADYVELDEMINKSLKKEKPIIFLYDELTDPNNLGAILRVVDAFSIDGIVISKKRNVQLNSTVAKVAAGAIMHTDVARVTNIKNSIKSLKKAGYWIAYLDMGGEVEIQDVDFTKPLAVVIGGEDKGVTDIMKKHCDFGINIQMSGHVNSLNVASATTILAYQHSISK